MLDVILQRVVRRVVVQAVSQTVRKVAKEGAKSGKDAKAVADAAGEDVAEKVVDSILLNDLFTSLRKVGDLEAGRKPWWKSSGIWGGAVAVIGGLFGIGGLSGGEAVPDGETTEIAGRGLELVFNQALAGLQAYAPTLAAVGGGLLAIYGRVTAKQEIK